MLLFYKIIAFVGFYLSWKIQKKAYKTDSQLNFSTFIRPICQNNLFTINIAKYVWKYHIYND